MTVHKIFSNWLTYNMLPTAKDIVLATLEGDADELELYALMYRDNNSKINMKECLKQNFKCLKESRALFLQNVSRCWTKLVLNNTENMMDTIEIIEFLDDNSDLTTEMLTSSSTEPYLSTDTLRTDTLGPPPPRQRSVSVETVEADGQKKSEEDYVATVDRYIAEKSKRRIHTLCSMSDALVPMDWVKQVASSVKSNEKDDFVIDKTNELTSECILLGLGNGERHVHHYNSSVIDFLKEFKNFDPDKTVTWQFSDSKTAIHFSSLKEALDNLCPETPYKFLIFACSIGLPISELMKTRELINKWKQCRFKQLTLENMIKLLLRDRFESKTSNIEVNELLSVYKDNIENFRVSELLGTEKGDVTVFFEKRFYAYPSANEMSFLFSRVTKNAESWCN